ncbi:DUF7490 domain-containing protein [Halorientalis regularis]|uniref:DUF7490 domain-containing protein n=1 Tax=Halorientalis regularis TaxID=660518 RepID=A0A1G7Q9F0_9EURY|nr:hypothetical protein [Halorientalis regularis]SDF95171.1 hypothetical protein SAMN05216218_11246 [Halorientalis regularis]
MERETKLLGAAGAVLVAAALFVAVAPGALADATPDPPPSELSVREQTIAAGDVTGGTATLSVRSRLSHDGGPGENVTVLVRAVDLDTDLVAAETTEEVGSVQGTREVPVVQNISVDREGDYRIETIVYQDGERVASGRKTVRGVGGLQPAYARTGVEFHSFEGFGSGQLPPIQFSIAETEGASATLNVTAYLTNTGDVANDQLRITFLARQADSNIVADRSVRRVGSIRPGRTAMPSTLLTVPDDYNYKLMAMIQADDVLVGTAQATATLNPNQTVTVDTTNSSADTLDTSDFETDEGVQRTERAPDERGTTSSSGPGFGVGAVAVAVLVVAIYARRFQ